MADIMDRLKVGATYTDNGMVAVDPFLLTSLAAQLTGLATTPPRTVTHPQVQPVPPGLPARPAPAPIEIHSPDSPLVVLEEDPYLDVLGMAGVEVDNLTFSDHSGIHHGSKFRKKPQTPVETKAGKESHKKKCTRLSLGMTLASDGYDPIRRLRGKKPVTLFSSRNAAPPVTESDL